LTGLRTEWASPYSALQPGAEPACPRAC